MFLKQNSLPGHSRQNWSNSTKWAVTGQKYNQFLSCPSPCPGAFFPLPGKMTQYSKAPAVLNLKVGNQEWGFKQSAVERKNRGKNETPTHWEQRNQEITLRDQKKQNVSFASTVPKL